MLVTNEPLGVDLEPPLCSRLVPLYFSTQGRCYENVDSVSTPGWPR